MRVSLFSCSCEQWRWLLSPAHAAIVVTVFRPVFGSCLCCARAPQGLPRQVNRIVVPKAGRRSRKILSTCCLAVYAPLCEAVGMCVSVRALDAGRVVSSALSNGASAASALASCTAFVRVRRILLDCRTLCLQAGRGVGGPCPIRLPGFTPAPRDLAVRIECHHDGPIPFSRPHVIYYPATCCTNPSADAFGVPLSSIPRSRTCHQAHRPRSQPPPCLRSVPRDAP